MLRSSTTEGLLEDIARAFGATSFHAMSSGGSSAKVVRFMCPGSESLVAKYQVPGTTLVDGHEVDALKRKVRQICRIRTELPEFSPYCTQVLGEFERDGAYGFVMPYHEGLTVTQRLLGGLGDGLSELRRLVDVMVDTGYAARTVAPWPHHFRDVHICRVRRRLHLVREYLPPVVRDAQQLYVNGHRAEHAGQLLERLEARPALLAALEPSALSLPVHGDAVLSNFIWHSTSSGDARFTAIDPRGTLDPWDPAYDLSKMFFSLSIYDLAMLDGFAIDMRRSPRGAIEMELHLRNGSSAYRRAASRFLDTIESTPSFGRLPLSREPHWRRRTLFASAMHCLAFAACRVADTRDRHTEGEAGLGEAKREGVLGFYLTGVAFLSALLDADGAGCAFEADEVMRLLPSGTGEAGSRALALAAGNRLPPCKVGTGP
jgi:hypothetical protein